MKKENCAHYQHGTQTNFCFVFSCPGKIEESEKCPASGQTGKNLTALLKILSERDTCFKNMEKDNLRITNAHDGVLHRANNEAKRTEAKISEIIQLPNISRLYEEISDIDKFIICSGKRAERALKEVQKLFEVKAKIVPIRHLGLQSLNQLLDTNQLRMKDTNERLSYIADIIIEKMNTSEAN